MRQIEVDDLEHERFMDAVSQEMGFRMDNDVLVYSSPSTDRVRVMSDREWKAV